MPIISSFRNQHHPLPHIQTHIPIINELVIKLILWLTNAGYFTFGSQPIHHCWWRLMVISFWTLMHSAFYNIECHYEYCFFHTVNYILYILNVNASCIMSIAICIKSYFILHIGSYILHIGYLLHSSLYKGWGFSMT